MLGREISGGWDEIEQFTVLNRTVFGEICLRRWHLIRPKGGDRVRAIGILGEECSTEEEEQVERPGGKSVFGMFKE